MKRIVVVAVALVTLALVACTPGQRQAARTAIDVATVACLIANASLPDAEVKRVCGVVDALDGPMKDLLRAQREQVALAKSEAAAVGCGPAAVPR